MTVSELIELLQMHDGNLTVRLSDDDEMNGTHECWEPTVRHVTEDGEYITKEDADDLGYLPDEFASLKKVVVL